MQDVIKLRDKFQKDVTETETLVPCWRYRHLDRSLQSVYGSVVEGHLFAIYQSQEVFDCALHRSPLDRLTTAALNLMILGLRTEKPTYKERTLCT
jgi:hypothetical protein